MLNFNTTTAGASLINAATEGTNPVIIDSVVLYNDNVDVFTSTYFSGSVYKDEGGIGEYCKITLEIPPSQTGYAVTQIALKSGSTVVALSEDVWIEQPSNKGLKLELSCLFEGAYKCGFNTYGVAIPYATPYREGVLRLSRDGKSETHKEWVVYSAKTVDEIIESISGIVPDSLVPWKQESGDYIYGTIQADHIEIVNSYASPSQTVILSINGQTSGVTNLSVSGYITGTAVANPPDLGSGSITGSPKLVNEIYISSLYANEVSKTNDSKLVTSYAVSSFVSDQISDLSNDLQSQIDALNAGQNLADIVDLVEDLKSHSLTNLKARGEGSITIGDKIQVLHDKTNSEGVVVPTDSGKATVYELVKGTPSSSNPKDQASTTSGYYWHYIGEYGCDSYTKSQSNTLFVAKEGLDQTLAQTSSTTNAPSTKAVYDAIKDLSDSIDDLGTTILNTISTTDEVGSIGLFMFTQVDSSTGIGEQLGIGSTISGQYLKPVGMSLPMSGQISYKSVAYVNPSTGNGLTGSWKLLSVAFKRTATEPCLVLAQKISDT